MSEINKRSERIASAIYLITSFFNDAEPLKWKMRSLASNIVSASVSLTDNISTSPERLRSEAHSAVLEILSHLSVAKNSGLVSDTNHDLVAGEFLKYADSFLIASDVSKVLAIEEAQEPLESNQREALKPAIRASASETIKDKIRPSIQVKELAPSPVSTGLLDDFDSMSQVPKAKEKLSKEFGVVSVKKNSRQSVIIGLLKRKKEIMIKDVSPLIAGVSEKTIQRELLAMVDQGILKKTGEKRWSRYSLA